MTPDLRIRRATLEDTPFIAEIYNAGIRGRNSTFETRERAGSDIEGWLNSPRHPVLVGVREGHVIGWISASSYRPRDCYSGIGEFSVYVSERCRGQRVGDQLMSAFTSACVEAGLWKLVSRIFPENLASRALCARHNFREVGVYRQHAQLDGVWRDVVIVERLLRSG